MGHLLLLNPVLSIVNSLSEVQRGLAAMDQYSALVPSERDTFEPPEARSADSRVRELRFEHVNFEYIRGQSVLRDINMTVPGGSVVALVGRSGAGKSTVTDLVARFHDPTSGRILLNGKTSASCGSRTYRRPACDRCSRRCFCSTGRCATTSRTAGGCDRRRDRGRRAAGQRARVHRAPAEGYDTLIGERGVKLSGGQQQRLAIARAMLAAPQILILDEATSNLDTESEHLIQESMATLFTARTTFVIAHRLSTVRRADLILLMEHGQIVERGTHDELMSARGGYYEMVSRQMASDDEELEEVRR